MPYERCCKELAGCQIYCIDVENVGLSTYMMTRPTHQQRELLTRVELPHLLEQEVLDIANDLSKERMSSKKFLDIFVLAGVSAMP